MSETETASPPQDAMVLPLASQFRMVYADHVITGFEDPSYQTLIACCKKIHYGTTYRYPDGNLGTLFLAEFAEDWQPPAAPSQEQ